MSGGGVGFGRPRFFLAMEGLNRIKVCACNPCEYFAHVMASACLPRRPIWGDNGRNLFI